MKAAASDLEGGGRNIVHSGTQALSKSARSELHLDNRLIVLSIPAIVPYNTTIFVPTSPCPR